MARMKLAIGPAATMAARRAHRLMEEALAALGLGHARDRGLVRHARGVVIAEKLHVAAERNGRKLPAGSVAVVEADEFRTETHRKSQHPHAAPARDQEVAELMEEHDDAQSEQKRDDPAGPTRAPEPKIAENVHFRTRPHAFAEPAMPQPISRMTLRLFRARGHGPTTLPYGQRRAPRRYLGVPRWHFAARPPRAWPRPGRRCRQSRSGRR